MELLRTSSVAPWRVIVAGGGVAVRIVRIIRTVCVIPQEQRSREPGASERADRERPERERAERKVPTGKTRERGPAESGGRADVPGWPHTTVGHSAAAPYGEDDTRRTVI